MPEDKDISLGTARVERSHDGWATRVWVLSVSLKDFVFFFFVVAGANHSFLLGPYLCYD